MIVKKNQYIDVYYNESEKEKAIQYGKQLIKRGYELSDQDTGGVLHYCDQYLKTTTLKKEESNGSK